MKWFKIDSDFYNDEKIIELLNDKDLGFKGFTIWIFLLSYLAEKWDGKSLTQEFSISQQKFSKSCKTYPQKLHKSLTKVAQKFNISYSKVGQNLYFMYPKFLEKQASYFRGVTTKSEMCRSRLKKEIKKEIKIKNNTIAQKTNVFRAELEQIYSEHYPIKKGKAKGIQKISSVLKSENDLSNFKKAVINYAKDCKDEDPKFIKHFSTFCNGDWEDYINYKPKQNGGMLNI